MSRIAISVITKKKKKIFQTTSKPKHEIVEHVKNIKRLLDFQDFIYQNSNLAYFICCVWEAQPDAVLFHSTNVTTSTSLLHPGVASNLFLMLTCSQKRKKIKIVLGYY